MFLQIKSFDATDEGQGIFTAYANVKYHKDKANDVTVDGAFMKSIEASKAKGRLPKMLLQHDYKQVCGVWLELEEDEKGLRVKGQLAMNTNIGRETYELMKMGALDSLSIGYVVIKERYDSVGKVNYLEELDIREISIVTFECNDESLIDSVKSEELEIITEEFEALNNTNDEEIGIQSKESIITKEQISKLDELVISFKLAKLF